MTDLTKLYLGKFVYGFGCLASYTFTLFFLGHGLTQEQIALLFSIYFIANLVLEIPTGGFADTYGPKASFALGLLIEAFYYLIFMLFPTFWGFAAGMAVAALGLSFQSGANDALTYELLKKDRSEKEYLKINGRLSAAMSAAVIIAAPLSTLIYKFSPSTPYLISFILVFISGLVVFSVRFNPAPDPSAADYVYQIKSGISLALKNPKLLALFLIGLVSLVSSYVLDVNISTPLQLRLGIDVALIGLIQSFIAVGYLIINYFSFRIVKIIGTVNTILLSLLFSSASLFILSQINFALGAGFIVVFFMSHGLRINIVNSLQQDESASAQRSTIASVGNTLKSLGTAALLPLWGLTLDRTGINHTLVLLGLFIIIIGVVGVYFYHRLTSRPA